jgi:hypothetical protein
MRGVSHEPLRVLAAVKSFADAGGRIGKLEEGIVASAVTKAIEVSTHLATDEELSELGAIKDSLESGGDGDTSYQDTPIDFRASILSEAEDSEAGRAWDVVMIQSGLTADGRYLYEPDAVRAAVDLFDSVQCFADHAPPGEVPSVKDLVGWFSDPRVEETDDGVAIVSTLHVLESSPYAGMLVELKQRDALNSVGLSINGEGDVKMEQSDDRGVLVVEALTSIDSTDLVTKPNAGGRIVELRENMCSAVDQLSRMNGSKTRKAATKKSSKVTRSNGGGNGASGENANSQQVLDEVNSLREELQAAKLETEIDKLVAASNLPNHALRTVESRIRGAGSVREAQDIINETRTILAIAEEHISASITGAGSVQVTKQSSRKVLALQGLIAGEPIEDVQPYRSLREAYGDVTGRRTDRMSQEDLAAAVVRGAWGYDSANVRLLATIDDTDWPYSLGQAIYRETVRQYALPAFNEWRSIVSKLGNLADMRTVTRVRTGYFDVLPTVTKGAAYQSLTEPSEEIVQYAPSKRGGLAEFTWEDALNDDLDQLTLIPKKLALSAKVTLWYNVLDVISNATPPDMDYDSIALFHASHSNLGSAALTLSAWTACRTAMRTQSVLSASTITIGTLPKVLLIPPDLEETALKLQQSEYDPAEGSTTSFRAANPWRNSFDIVVIPFWSDADAWAAVGDVNMIPTIEVGFLGGREEPDVATEAVNSGSNFTADKVVYRVRQVFGIKALDHRGMYKSVP